MHIYPHSKPLVDDENLDDAPEQDGGAQQITHVLELDSTELAVLLAALRVVAENTERDAEGLGTLDSMVANIEGYLDWLDDSDDGEN